MHREAFYLSIFVILILIFYIHEKLNFKLYLQLSRIFGASPDIFLDLDRPFFMSFRTFWIAISIPSLIACFFEIPMLTTSKSLGHGIPTRPSITLTPPLIQILEQEMHFRMHCTTSEKL